MIEKYILIALPNLWFNDAMQYDVTLWSMTTSTASIFIVLNLNFVIIL